MNKGWIKCILYQSSRFPVSLAITNKYLGNYSQSKIADPIGESMPSSSKNKKVTISSVILLK